MADRYDNLNHNNMMASIGSMPRRWSDAICLPAPQNIEDVFTEEGPGGIVIADEMGAAIHQMELLDLAIRVTSYLDPEPLPDGTVDAAADRLSGSRPKNAAQAIADIVEVNESAYKRLSDLRMADWSKSGTQNGVTMNISDLAKGVSRVNAERLARATRAVESFR